LSVSITNVRNDRQQRPSATGGGLWNFDPFSGNGLNTLELVWEPCVNKFAMAPPLVVCCVSQNDAVSVSVMRLNGLGDHEVESPTRQMSFKLPLAVVIVDRNNAVAKATVETNGALGAVIGPPL
jgi:hypothetical protein